jgi:hypothetical protein
MQPPAACATHRGDRVRAAAPAAQLAAITVDYPIQGSLFPPEILAITGYRDEAPVSRGRAADYRSGAPDSSESSSRQ